MKYRRLTTDELQELENEFILFLSSNQVTAPEWTTIKAEQPEKADELIDLFSDIVFENTLAKIEYLEYKEPKDIKTFHCQEDKIVMLGMIVEGESNIDFTKETSLDQMMGQMKLSGARLKLYQAEKAYSPNREDELFKMLESGCLISKEGTMFKTLEQLRS
jgi:hypothetical protein